MDRAAARTAEARALARLLEDLAALPQRSPEAERTVARLTARLLTSEPVRTDLLTGFDAGKTRHILGRALRERDAAPRPRFSGDVVSEAGANALSRQMAEIFLARESGRTGRAEMTQAAFLAGLSGQARDAALGWLGVVATALDGQIPASASRAWERGRARRESLLSRAGRPSRATAVNTALTAVRVTELLTNSPGPAHARDALRTKLRRRSLVSREGADVLVVNGAEAAGLSDSEIRNRLAKRFPKNDAMRAYLERAVLVRLADESFAPEAVFAALPEALSAGRTLNLFTADLRAVLADAARKNAPYRVILLEWMAGDIRSVDVTALAREAIQAARVVRSNA